MLTSADSSGEGRLLDAAREISRRWKFIVIGTLLASAVAAGVSMVTPPTFTARTTLLPPAQQQSLASAALGSLGALGSLAAAPGVLKNPADQYAGLLLSVTVTDRMIDAFDLMSVYAVNFREDARRGLGQRTLVSIGRRDGLMTIEVEDRDRARAAAMANRYVAELRRLSNELALTEAQQRRRFFESQLDATRKKLEQAQAGLQASGLSQGVLRAEPKAAAENYARLRAEAEASAVRLRMLRVSLADAAPEVQQQLGMLAALRERLAQAELNTDSGGSTSYLSVFREFKYQESLFDLLSRQFEMARVDEARDGTLLQVVDAAQPPERRSRPRRTELVTMTAAVSLVLLVLIVLARLAWRRMTNTTAVTAGNTAQPGQD